MRHSDNRSLFPLLANPASLLSSQRQAVNMCVLICLYVFVLFVIVFLINLFLRNPLISITHIDILCFPHPLDLFKEKIQFWILIFNFLSQLKSKDKLLFKHHCSFLWFVFPHSTSSIFNNQIYSFLLNGTYFTGKNKPNMKILLIDKRIILFWQYSKN